MFAIAPPRPRRRAARPRLARESRAGRARLSPPSASRVSSRGAARAALPQTRLPRHPPPRRAARRGPPRRGRSDHDRWRSSPARPSAPAGRCRRSPRRPPCRPSCPPRSARPRAPSCRPAASRPRRCPARSSPFAAGPPLLVALSTMKPTNPPIASTTMMIGITYSIPGALPVHVRMQTAAAARGLDCPGAVADLAREHPDERTTWHAHSMERRSPSSPPRASSRWS